RMALGQDGVKRPPQPPFSRERLANGGPAPSSSVMPDRESLLPPPGEEPPAARSSSRELSAADKSVMSKQIENRLQSRASLALSRLRKYEDIRVQMANGRLPRTIGIPAPLLFDNSVLFKKGSGEILDILSDLAFSLGATQLVLLPERAMLGDAKILDMRRTMAVSAHLYKAGVSPSRVRVNLLSNQVDIPKEFTDFQGMMVAFVYNQPLSLKTESTIDSDAGPPISIGTSPGSIDPRKDEGSVIEFSVVEPPAGLMSWSFQLSGPGKAGSPDMVTLQEVKGAAPVFHQIYWNGRQGYFGDPLPAGRYQCLLSATDMKGRTRKKLQWISVEGNEVKPQKAKREPLLSRRSAGPPPSELSPDETSEPGPRRVTIGRHAPPKRSRRRKTPRPVTLVARPKEEAPDTVKPAEPEASPAAAAQPAPAAPAKAQEPSPESTVSNWSVLFARGTLNIVQDGEAQISKAAEILSYYPLDSLQLTGYASSQEPDAESLAARRADYVADRLAKGYKVDTKRIQRQHKVVENEFYKVEIYALPGK
ncbi:MAG TPA: OmpA family protein, partial [Elusimicrobiota bacterium]|nr:OmpA family protein [Elusimicrobiota bacterium]